MIFNKLQINYNFYNTMQKKRNKLITWPTKLSQKQHDQNSWQIGNSYAWHSQQTPSLSRTLDSSTQTRDHHRIDNLWSAFQLFLSQYAWLHPHDTVCCILYMCDGKSEHATRKLYLLCSRTEDVRNFSSFRLRWFENLEV